MLTIISKNDGWKKGKKNTDFSLEKNPGNENNTRATTADDFAIWREFLWQILEEENTIYHWL